VDAFLPVPFLDAAALAPAGRLSATDDPPEVVEAVTSFRLAPFGGGVVEPDPLSALVVARGLDCSGGRFSTTVLIRFDRCLPCRLTSLRAFLLSKM